MKTLLYALLILIASVALALFIRQDPGYLMLAWSGWVVESTLAVAIFALLILFVGTLALLRSARTLTSLPSRLRDWLKLRRQRRARRLSNDGLVALAEGRWKRAEKQLVRSARSSETPLLNYLSAARAAQELQADERRDRYLMLAHDSAPGADIAVELTQAELQIGHAQYEEALATLSHLRTLVPGHPYVLRQLMRIYHTLKSWDDLHRLLPELARHEVISVPEHNRLAAEVYCALLEEAAGNNDVERMESLWDGMSNDVRLCEEVQHSFARLLLGCRQMARAEEIARSSLQRGWSERLVHLYGLIPAPDPRAQLHHAEAWLKGRERHPVVLLAVGRIALRNELWGKARSYLEASLETTPTAEAHQELATLLEHLGEAAGSIRHCRDGLRLAIRQLEQARLQPG